MSRILVYSEMEEIALRLLTKGRALAAGLGKQLAVGLIGNKAIQEHGIYFSHGASQIYIGNDPVLAHFQAGTYAAALTQVVQQAEADIILMGSTRRGRELAPRLAQKLSAGCVTDAIGLDIKDDRLHVERRALGGNTISTSVITSSYQVITVMPKLFDAEPGDRKDGQVISVQLQLEQPKTRFVERRPKEAGDVNVEEADVLICVGRGIANHDDLSHIDQLAKTVGGMVACTRPISHEYHWLPEDQMIGLSGKESSPSLYIGIGVSGQIQHTVGIMGAKIIVAINSDKNAPIFKVADYGIVGDLYQVVPDLIEGLKSALGK